MKSVLLALVALVFSTAAFAQAAYQLRAGDQLAVEVLEDPSLNRTLLVLPDGTVNFPFAGAIRASGRTADEVARAITAGIASNFTSEPTVFVTVAGLRPPAAPTAPAAPAVIDVFMMGEVGSPGVKQLEPGTTFLQALAATGGFTKFAAEKRILLRRTDPVTGRNGVFQINYKAIAAGAALSHDIVLKDGDVIIVPERRLFE